MNQEHQIVRQVQKAQGDSRAADQLIRQYLPFIKSETARFLKRPPDESQDELNIAMFAFYESILSYRTEKGSFLMLASTAIRNRLIDYARKEQRHKSLISLELPSSQDDSRSLGEQLSDRSDKMNEVLQITAARTEIEEFSHQLESFGLTLSDIADNCPRQERTMEACMKVLDYAKSHPQVLVQMIHSKKLPLAQLATGSGTERKTLERHRKYLVAILLAYTNGFEIIRGHLQFMKRKEKPL